MKVLVLPFIVMLIMSACGSCGSPQKAAVGKAEVACLTKIGAALAEKLAEAKASGQAVDRLAVSIELGVEEVACAVEALGAKPPAGSGSGG